MIIRPVDEEAAGSVIQDIERRLLSSLASINTQSTNTSILFEANDDLGERVGGIAGSTSYGWLLVKLLWVRDDQRRRGVGRRLMAIAEEKARAVGCHSAWLDTSNAHAHAFYLKLGYRDFGLLKNGPGRSPEGHSRWFMMRHLG